MTVLMRKHMYRVDLSLGRGLSTSVFIKAKNRATAERRALNRYPNARIPKKG